ncbi:hypothetical protein Tco_0637148 [Tanacetum coccineum]
MLHTCYGYGLTKGTIIQIFYHGLDDLTQGILEAGGIFLYKTPNEAFKILEDKVLLNLDFSKGSHVKPKPKIVVSVSGRSIDYDHTILMEKFKALATKINFEFLKIRKELKEMRDGRRDNHASQIYMKDDTLMCDLMELNYVQGYHGVWICQILQEISQKRTRERMSDQEAKEIKAEAREIMPQPSTVNCS